MTESRIGFSNKLDLDRFFFELRNQIYVVVKLSDTFPNYYKGSDIDVFCYDKDQFARHILRVGKSYVDQGFEIKVTDCDETHAFVDFYVDGKLDFRFDLYQSLPPYRKIRLKSYYMYSVVENAIPISRDFHGVQYDIYVPSSVDDLLLRYVEYIEWYETRPDKIKHLEYIMRAISGEPSRIGFLDKLHLYTELPSPDYGSSDRASSFGSSLSWLARVRSIPLRRVPRVFFRKLGRIAGRIFITMRRR